MGVVLADQHPKGKLRNSHGRLSPKAAASGRKSERLSPRQSLRHSIIEDSLAPALDRSAPKAGAEVDVDDISIEMSEQKDIQKNAKT